MHLKTKDLSGPVTVTVGDWKTDLRTFNLRLNYPLEEGARGLFASLSNESRKQTLFTPSNLVFRHPSLSAMTTARVHSALRSPAVQDGDYKKREFTLDIIRRMKLTRREVAKEAKVEDFRSMNYWLRGKDPGSAMVISCGEKVHEWAKRTAQLLRRGFQNSFRPAQKRTREESSEDADESDDDDGDGRSLPTETPLIKRVRAMQNGQYFTEQTLSASTEPFILDTPISERRHGARSVRTPVPFRVASPPMTANRPQSQIPISPSFYATFSNLNTPMHGFYSPAQQNHTAQTPSLVDASSNSTHRSSEEGDHGGKSMTPSASPFGSPNAMLEMMGEERMLDATPGFGATPNVQRNFPAPTGRTASRKLF